MVTHNKGEFTDAAEAKYTDIFEKYGQRGRHPYNEFITGKDYVFTQSDAIEQMLTMKISFRESARGGTRRGLIHTVVLQSLNYSCTMLFA